MKTFNLWLRRSAIRGTFSLTILCSIMLSLCAHAQNVVTQWNDIAITQARASSAPGATSAGATSLYVAYVELAVYNSVVAIEGHYEPYKYSVPAARDASPEAAAVEAAYRMLLHLLPDRATALTAAYNSSMAGIPDGPCKTAGQAVGLFSANTLISLRAGDGLGVPWPYSYPSAPEPGVYIPTPGVTSLVTPWAGQMRPFTFDNPDQFLPAEPPPPLKSREWAEDYNEVKLLGAVDSTVRTPAQTEIGLFWTDHTTAQYGRMLQLLAMQENMSVLDSSRLMAMSFTSLADAYIGCFNGKYHFSFWRPVTAIRNGDIDGNELTIADPTWTPLGVTPGHPEYPAAHACLTGSLADTLEQYFGTPRVHLTVSSAVTNTTHYFQNVHELEREIEGARIYAGFHYHHSLIQGFLLGHRVSQNVTANYFAPDRKHPRD
ncbi:MAG TPA: vanadium-dependent haloperoxidase [Candidatus Sulfotelmatobacter sp.]|jgi:hypothetical protein